jgi:hypothetical protein
MAAEPCTVAYMGASVMVQRDGYRPRLHDAIVRDTGREHRSVTATVGAVGAVSAVALMDDLVLRHQPDLCFVEYSSGDMLSDSPIEDVRAAVEGIVGKLLEAGAVPVILHMHRTPWTERCAEVVAAWEEVADAYGVPTIDAGAGIAAAIDRGELERDAIFKDVIHTTASGGAAVAELTAGAFAQLLDAPEQRGPARPAKPVSGQDFRRARLVRATEDDADGEAKRRLFRLQMPYVEVPDGVSVRTTLPGELLGIAVLTGRDAGEVRVTSPGNEERAMVWDDFSFYERLTTFVLRNRVPAGTAVEIALTDAVPDYATCKRPVEEPDGLERRLRIVGYMVLG